MGERTHTRNIRPKSGRLPVVDFRSEERFTDCPACDGDGTLAVDCAACNGDGYDAAGNPCPRCNTHGITWTPCRGCAGEGKIPA
jgi:hypothetical protein